MQSTGLKIRVFAVAFIGMAVCVLLLLNREVSGIEIQYADRASLLVGIFFIVIAVGLFIIFEVYQIVRRETIERINMLEDSRNDMQLIYNSVSIRLIEVDPEGRILNANSAAGEFLGVGLKELSGQRLTEVPGFDGELATALMEMVADSSRRCLSLRREIETKGYSFEVSTFHLQSTAGIQEKILLMLNDITQIKTVNKQLLQENKMSAIGQLAAGVAHEIRNPLGLIRYHTYMLRKKLEADEMGTKSILMIENAVERSGSIIDNLLRFSRLSGEVYMDLNLNQCVRSLIDFEAHMLSAKRIHVALDCADDLWIVTIPESFEMIVLNLLMNAMDAIGEDGQIEIACVAKGDRVAVSVSDTGGGIPEEIGQNIFNPFFTTKEQGTGTGLGLYIVYNEVKKINGNISFVSKAGHGTAFTLDLPQEGSAGADQSMVVQA